MVFFKKSFSFLSFLFKSYFKIISFLSYFLLNIFSFLLFSKLLFYLKKILGFKYFFNICSLKRGYSRGWERSWTSREGEHLWRKRRERSLPATSPFSPLFSRVILARRQCHNTHRICPSPPCPPPPLPSPYPPVLRKNPQRLRTALVPLNGCPRTRRGQRGSGGGSGGLRGHRARPRARCWHRKVALSVNPPLPFPRTSINFSFSLATRRRQEAEKGSGARAAPAPPALSHPPPAFSSSLLPFFS